MCSALIRVVIILLSTCGVSAAWAVDLTRHFYAVYEQGVGGGAKTVFIVPKETVLILHSDIATPITFMPDVGGYQLTLNVDGSLGAISAFNVLNGRDLSADPNYTLSSYVLHGGDLTGDGDNDLLLQGAGNDASFIITDDGTAASVYYNFGTDLAQGHVSVSVYNLSGNSAADVIAIDSRGNQYTYISDGTTSQGGFTNTGYQSAVPDLSPSGDEPEAQGADYYGWLAGGLQINAQGNAIYNIALDTPPGRGVAPKLSINYDSAGSNGLLGQGFSLSGLSGIRRCATTVAQDGFIDPVDYDDNDAFCLDGQRLIETIPGSQEYRTHIDTFSRVRAYGAAIDPDYFIVETKGGKIKEYGRTADSRIEAQGRTQARVWAVNEVADTLGNHYTVHYTEENAVGDYRVNEIRYVHVGASYYNRVAFSYENRPDSVPRYQAGSKVQRTQRLSNVATYVDGVQVKEYRLAYQQDNASNRSQLLSVTECAGMQCRAPKTFIWSESLTTPSFSVSANTDNYTGVTLPGSGLDPYEKFFWAQIDFNHDGRLDLVRNGHVVRTDPADPASEVVRNIALKLINQGGGWSVEEVNTVDGVKLISGLISKKRVADFNGDGLTDYFGVGNDRRIIPVISGYLADGQGDWVTSRWSPVSGLLSPNEPDERHHGVYVGDVDGDGLVDVVRRSFSGNNRIYFNQGDGTWLESAVTDNLQYWPDGSWPEVWKSGDFNGDGRTDIADCNYLLLSNFNPGGVGSWESFSQNLCSHPSEIKQAVDVNGDGLTDLITNDTVWFADGVGGWVQQSITKPSEMRFFDHDEGTALLQYLKDFNGDGYIDVLNIRRASSFWNTIDAYYFYLGDGQGTWSLATTVDITYTHQSGDENVWFVGDADGDGDMDIVRRNNNGTQNHIVTNNHVQSRLIGIRDEKHTDLTIVYKPLFDASVYSLGGCQPTLDNKGLIIEHCVKDSRYVVSDVYKNNGKTTSSSIRHTSYYYEGLKKHNRGYGDLGFARKVRTDHDIDGQGSNMVSTSDFRQSFPYTGLAHRTQIELSTGQILERTDFQYQTHGDFQTNGYAFPYLSQKDKRDCDLATHCTDVTIDQGYTRLTSTTNHSDDYGQLTQISTSMTDASGIYLSQTQNTYDNTRYITPTVWLLERAINTKVRGGTGDGILHGSERETSANYHSTNGLLIQSVVEPNGSASQRLQIDYQHDAYGNVIQMSATGSGQTRITNTVYDSRGQFAESVTNALGQTISSQYERRYGQVTQVTDINNLVTTTDYDAWGRPVRKTLPDGTQTDILYHYAAGVPGTHADALNYVESKTSGQTAVRVFTDRFGREVRSRVKGFDGAFINTDTRYDQQGRVNGLSQPYYEGDTLYWTTTTYDVLDRVTQVVSPINGTMTKTYDGLATTVTNAKNQTRINYNNSLGQTLWIKDAANNSNTFEYDAFGNLVRVTDPHNNSIINNYDILGRKTQMNDPDSGVWTYSYNAFGELLSQTDAKNQTQTMVYNALGQLIRRTDADGISQWGYGNNASQHNVGQLISETLTENGGIVWQRSQSYDNFARPSSSTTQMDGYSYTVGQNYDSYGRLHTLSYPVSPSYPSGFKITHQYNDRGYLERLTDTHRHVHFQQVAANALGKSTAYYLGDGSTTLRTFEPGTERLTVAHAGAAGLTLQNYSYQYDVLGTLTQRHDNQRNLSESFTFDELNRVKTSTVVGLATKSYDYDALGNITYKTGVGNYSYGGCNAGPHAVCQAGNTTYQYDVNGSRLSSSDGGSLSWTATANKPRLISKGGYSSRFAYDANKARYKHNKIDATGTSTIYYVSGIYERIDSVSGTEHKQLISIGGETIALNIDRGSQIDTHYIHKDHLGSYGTVTNQAMQVLENNSYDVFGERRSAVDWSDDSTARSIETRGYTGHEHLDDLALIHMNGRVYDPVIGRFTSADPFIPDATDLQSYNRYSYARNNPLNRTDPTGFTDENDDDEFENEDVDNRSSEEIRADIEEKAQELKYEKSQQRRKSIREEIKKELENLSQKLGAEKVGFTADGKEYSYTADKKEEVVGSSNAQESDGSAYVGSGLIGGTVATTIMNCIGPGLCQWNWAKMYSGADLSHIKSNLAPSLLVGRSIVGVGAALELGELKTAVDNSDRYGVADSSLDLGMIAPSALGGPVGLGLGLFYSGMDVFGGFDALSVPIVDIACSITGDC